MPVCLENAERGIVNALDVPDRSAACSDRLLSPGLYWHSRPNVLPVRLCVRRGRRHGAYQRSFPTRMYSPGISILNCSRIFASMAGSMYSG